MILCEYGCGKEGKFLIGKKKRWCCEPHYTKCLKFIEKTNLKKRGRTWNEMYGKEEADKRRNINSIYMKNNNPMKTKSPWNKGKIGVYSSETLSKMRIGGRSNKGKTWEDFVGKENANKRKEEQGIRIKINIPDVSGKNNPMFGKSHNKYSKELMREKKLGFIPWNKGKKGLQKQTIEEIERSRNYMLNGHAAYMNSCIKNPSNPQSTLFNLCQKLLPYPILNYPCLNYSIDIAIPKLNIAIEYDGSYWHQDKEKDYKRQHDLEEEGWIFLRYIDNIPTEENLLYNIRKLINGKL